MVENNIDAYKNTKREILFGAIISYRFSTLLLQWLSPLLSLPHFFTLVHAFSTIIALPTKEFLL